MKKLVFYLLTLYLPFFFSSKDYNLRDVDYWVDYDFWYLLDSTSTEYSNIEPYRLIGFDKKSWFMHSYVLQDDSISAAFFSKNPLKKGGNNRDIMKKYWKEEAIKTPYNVTEIQSEKDFIKSKNTIILYDSANRWYLSEDQDLRWTITTSHDTINGLHCLKAKTNYGGRNYTAWFSPEIPISDGPYIFSGLPGLITKVIDDEKRYIWQLKRLSTKQSKMYLKPSFLSKKYLKEIDRKTYVQQTKSKQTDPQMALGVSWTPEQRSRHKKKYETRLDLLIEKK